MKKRKPYGIIVTDKNKSGVMYVRNREAEAIRDLITKEEFKFLRNENDGFVILLNGAWGSGKTTFINNNLIPTLNENSNIKKVINYNAWENDDFDSPMITFMHYLNEQYEGSLNAVKDDLLKIVNLQKKKLFHATGVFMSNTLFSVIKNKVGVDMREIVNQLKELQSEIEEEPWENMEDFEEFLRAKESLKGKLKSLSNSDKIVVIIDELDRCKPDFAINTLEMIKHYFSIENFVFIISADQVQLMESAKTMFGQNMDSDVYFSKFYDFKFNLDYLDSNIISTELREDVMGDFFDLYSSTYNFTIEKYVGYMFDKLSVSLREQIKILKELSVLSRGKSWSFPKRCVYSFLVILKYTDIVIYNSFVRGEYVIREDNVNKQYLLIPNKYRFMYFNYVQGNNDTIDGFNNSIINLTESGGSIKELSKEKQPRNAQIRALFGHQSGADTIHDLIDLNMKV